MAPPERVLRLYYELTDHFIVPANLDKTWDFFSRAENLARITPAWMHFRILTPGPLELKQDSLIDYRIRMHGLPMLWRTRIIDWNPPYQFIDLQIKGPYTLWHHQHTFKACDEGTACTDRVMYKLPGGPVGPMVHALQIRRMLGEIFRYRRKVIRKELGWVRAVQDDVQIRRIG
jgi:ligand-binding SRPBCC domain-containing protein